MCPVFLWPPLPPLEQVRAKGFKKALGEPSKGAKPAITASAQKEVRCSCVVQRSGTNYVPTHRQFVYTNLIPTCPNILGHGDFRKRVSDEIAVLLNSAELILPATWHRIDSSHHLALN